MPRQSARDRELAELTEQQARAWKRWLAQSRQRISASLSNEAGFARLRAISDEEWEAAVQAGEPEETEGAG